jgi:tetratricopeptide (TPR) repeat protein
MGYPSRKSWVIAGVTILGFGAALVAGRGWRPSQPENLAALAREAMKKEQWARADSLLRRYSQQPSPISAGAVIRAELELRRGRLDEALRLLTEIPDSDPHAAGARLAAGQIEKIRNRVRLAEALFLEALRLDPKLALARRELMLIYAMQARRLDLNAQFGALAELEPLKFDDVLLWTASLEDIWINDTIRTDLERYLAADPEDRMSRLALAEVLLKSGNFEETEAILQSLPETDVEGRVLRARLALSRLHLDEVRSLIAQGPVEHTGLALLRGQFAARTNDPATAARQFRIALRLDPTNREAIHGLSLVLQQRGEHDAAASYRRQGELWRTLSGLLEKVKSSEQRQNRVLLRQLGETCAALGRNREARVWYHLLLALDPLDGTVQQALYHLRDQTP